MSPRETSFTREAVLAAAIGLVREEGWQSLTARAVAKRLGASVAPVYSTFGSMEALEREILEEARRRLEQAMAASYTPKAFLNIGVGMVVFAREEAHLFSALFHTRHSHSDIVDAIFASILESMKSDAMLRLLPDASLERLLHNLGMYTLGLAASIVYGRREDPSTGNIVRQLRNAGNMMIHGEVSGLAEAESPESDQEWQRIFEEKHIRLSGPHAAARRGANGSKKETS
jgi:AcrR family transcriptional regulator